MKKIICSVLCVIILLLQLTVSAAGTNALLCTLHTEDMAGTAYQLFLMRCTGHYDAGTDSVTLYITNMSNKDAEFQVHIGYNGDADKKVTSISSGFVKLGAGVTAKFELTDLYDVPEKANDDLGYVPDSHLSGTSVIRIQSNGLEAGDSFRIMGIDSYGEARSTAFKLISEGAVITTSGELSDMADAKKVIKDKDAEGENKTFGWTMKQPSEKLVDGFTIFIAVSAILCAGGVIIYLFSILIKRRKQHD